MLKSIGIGGILSFLVAGCLSKPDSGGMLIPEQQAYDVTYHDIQVSVFPETKTIEGAVTTIATILAPLEWFVIDLDASLAIQQALLLGDEKASLVVERRGNQAWLKLPKTLAKGTSITLQIDYKGHPRIAPNPPWEGGFTWSKTQEDIPWVATSVQVNGADLWLPIKDHPSDEPDSVRIHITVPKPLKAISNGRLEQVETSEASSTFHWFVSTPINLYNIALNIAPYETLTLPYESVSGKKMQLSFWVLPEDISQAEQQFLQFLDHLQWFENLLGPYPFQQDKYGIAQTPFLGMEHQTIIAYGNHFLNNTYGFDELHHHELAHEWFGNMLTVNDWKDFWLHEGFAEYMQPLYVEQLHGKKKYQEAMLAMQNSISTKFTLAPLESRSTQQMYGLDIYRKGAWVLHVLRFVIGDEAFFKTLRQFAYPDSSFEAIDNRKKYRFVTTADFIQVAEEVSQQDLGWFFDRYLRQPDLPHLVATHNENVLHLAWQTKKPFPMPVEVELDGTLQRLNLPNGEAEISITPQTALTIDPNHWLLRK